MPPPLCHQADGLGSNFTGKDEGLEAGVFFKYIYIEREREIHTYIYIQYIYTYIYRYIRIHIYTSTYIYCLCKVVQADCRKKLQRAGKRGFQTEPIRTEAVSHSLYGSLSSVHG